MMLQIGSNYRILPEIIRMQIATNLLLIQMCLMLT